MATAEGKTNFVVNVTWIMLSAADWLGACGQNGANHRAVRLGLPVTSLSGQEGQQGLHEHSQVCTRSHDSQAYRCSHMLLCQLLLLTWGGAVYMHPHVWPG